MGDDVISRILTSTLDTTDHGDVSELALFLDDGVSTILTERKDPYFTIAKQKIKQLITFADESPSVDYTNKMIKSLLRLESYIADQTMDLVFVEICLECARDKNIITREALILLNEIHNSINR